MLMKLLVLFRSIFWRDSMGFLGLLIPASIACICNALANMFWKMRFDKIPLSIKSVQDIGGLLISPHIWAGLCCYGCSMLIFFYMLSNYKLSSIMPVTCMTYIFNIVIARVIFHESIERMQIVGTVIVICGLIILSRGNVAK